MFEVCVIRNPANILRPRIYSFDPFSAFCLPLNFIFDKKNPRPFSRESFAIMITKGYSKGSRDSLINRRK